MNQFVSNKMYSLIMYWKENFKGNFELLLVNFKQIIKLYIFSQFLS